MIVQRVRHHGRRKVSAKDLCFRAQFGPINGLPPVLLLGPRHRATNELSCRIRFYPWVQSSIVIPLRPAPRFFRTASTPKLNPDVHPPPRPPARPCRPRCALHRARARLHSGRNVQTFGARYQRSRTRCHRRRDRRKKSRRSHPCRALPHFIYRILEWDEAAQILGVIVATSHQRRRLSRALTERAEPWARERDGTMVYLRHKRPAHRCHQFLRPSWLPQRPHAVLFYQETLPLIPTLRVHPFATTATMAPPQSAIFSRGQPLSSAGWIAPCTALVP